MTNLFAVLGSVLIGLAALIHVYIFFLESIAWSKPATWKTFGMRSQAEADTVRPMAYNQGFYNLFLAIGAGLGIILLALGVTQAGYALALFAALSMAAAATVLILSNRRLARSALIQGAAPLLGSVLLLVSLAA